jgi:hypothetical protein
MFANSEEGCLLGLERRVLSYKFSSVSEVRAASMIRAMMEKVQTFETFVYLHQSTWHYNPEDSLLHTHRRVHLKSYLANFVCYRKNRQLRRQGDYPFWEMGKYPAPVSRLQQ